MRWLPLVSLSLLLLGARAEAHAGLLADVARLTRELESSPSSATYLRRASTLRLLRRLDEALADVEAARASGAGAAEVAEARGLVLWAGGDATGALAEFDRQLALGVVSVPTLEARAQALEQLGRRPEAALDLARAVALAPEPDRFLELARVQETLERPADAQQTLERGLTTLGQPVTLRLALVALYRRTGQPALALAHVRAAARGQAVATQWQLLEAELLLEQGRPREAIAALQATVTTLDAQLAKRRSAMLEDARGRALALLAKATTHTKEPHR